MRYKYFQRKERETHTNPSAERNTEIGIEYIDDLK
tara:strand:+ start:246 stop:350 length:105 start_codon:yes stop_codon:yes gene_type:complete